MFRRFWNTAGRFRQYATNREARSELIERFKYPNEGDIKLIVKWAFLGTVIPAFIFVKTNDSSNLRYKFSFTRAISRGTGRIADYEWPEFIKKTIINGYIKIVGIDLEEAEEKTYKNLQELFTRKLKPGARKIGDASIVSPCDGRVLTYGEVTHDFSIETLKGVPYSVSGLISGSQLSKNYPQTLKKDKNKKLWYISLYLSPRDCHRFNTPTDWTIMYRRHLAGFLYTVFPASFKLKPRIFETNERVVYIGQYEHGFFSFIPIGALNVGGIVMHFDKTLKTNHLKDGKIIKSGKNFEKAALREHEIAELEGKSLPKPDVYGVKVTKGEECGVFLLGSSIVLIFEGDEADFKVEEGDKIQIGASLVDIK